MKKLIIILLLILLLTSCYVEKYTFLELYESDSQYIVRYNYTGGMIKNWVIREKFGTKEGANNFIMLHKMKER